ncbi:hypothetical protein AMTRI_Chr01g137480 [Amborella trichopoda]
MNLFLNLKNEMNFSMNLSKDKHTTFEDSCGSCSSVYGLSIYVTLHLTNTTTCFSKKMIGKYKETLFTQRVDSFSL